jgi:hypothetical protein
MVFVGYYNTLVEDFEDGLHADEPFGLIHRLG